MQRVSEPEAIHLVNSSLHVVQSDRLQILFDLPAELCDSGDRIYTAGWIPQGAIRVHPESAHAFALRVPDGLSLGKRIIPGAIIHYALVPVDPASYHWVRPSILANIPNRSQGVMNYGPYSRCINHEANTSANALSMIVLDVAPGS